MQVDQMVEKHARDDVRHRGSDAMAMRKDVKTAAHRVARFTFVLAGIAVFAVHRPLSSELKHVLAGTPQDRFHAQRQLNPFRTGTSSKDAGTRKISRLLSVDSDADAAALFMSFDSDATRAREVLHKAPNQSSVEFLTFAKDVKAGSSSSKWEQSQKRVAMDAVATGFFDGIYNLSSYPTFIVNDPRWAQHMSTHKIAWWFWKSALAKELMFNRMRENDLLFYADAGCELVNMSQVTAEFFPILCEHDVIAFSLDCPPCSDKRYTESKVFELFDVKKSDPYYGKTQQVHATYFIVRNTAATRRFMVVWEYLASRHWLIQGGRDSHRHDQSLWSMLIKANSPTFAKNADDCNGCQKYPREPMQPKHPVFGIDGLRPYVMQSLRPASIRNYIFDARTASSNRRFVEAVGPTPIALSPEETKEFKTKLIQCIHPGATRAGAFAGGGTEPPLLMQQRLQREEAKRTASTLRSQTRRDPRTIATARPQKPIKPTSKRKRIAAP